ncbi:MAG TPA: tyrosine-type recombinase/integrase [Candidatus Acidoferrales bacterium]|nr:tyrosine-type recombinase/integrase [Candidatus Acidoferrales bacterium]
MVEQQPSRRSQREKQDDKQEKGQILTEDKKSDVRGETPAHRRTLGGMQPEGGSLEALPEQASPKEPEPQKLVSCPQCGHSHWHRNGHEDSDFGVDIQRYICLDCGGRFSDPDDLKRSHEVAASYLASIETASLNAKGNNTENSQVCAIRENAKNLTGETSTQVSVSQMKNHKELTNIDLVIADYKQYMQKEHLLNDLTLSKYVFRLKWLANEMHVNLFDPDDFKQKLAFNSTLSTKSNCNKNSICKAYTSFVKKYLHMEDVKIPHFEYKTPEYNPPQPDHMEMLYAALSDQMRVFCFVLMATAARPIEALRIEWKDIDFARKTIAINKPAKHGRTRTVPLKGRFVKVIDMLAEWKKQQYNIATCRSRVQRNLNLVFTYKDTDTAGENFRRARKAAARRLGMPELEKITFYSNRHWRAVLERYLTGNPDKVANLLGENSTKYVAVYAPISERLYGSDKEWDPIEICETDPDYSEKMLRYGLEDYIEYSYNRTTGRHYLHKEKNVY